MDRLRAIESFVRIVRVGSFAEAASQLGLSRSLLTSHVQQLEAHVGARLLNRTTRHVSLTEVGEGYFNFCARMLADLDVTETAIRDRQKSASGQLKILSPRAFGTGRFALALAGFMQAHPQLEITLVLGDSSSHSFGGDEDIDVVIRLWQIPPDSSMVARQVGWLDWGLFAAPTYLAKAAAIRQPEDLAGANCLIQPQLAPERMWRFEDGTSVKVGGRFTSNGILALRAAAIAGAGVVQLPFYYVHEELQSGGLQQVLAAHGLSRRPIYVVLPNPRFTPARVRTFVDFFSAWCRSRDCNPVPDVAPEGAVET
jgi:DNA-binding transcriptional LysR family regulator